jgi:hypothetical protein
VCDSVLFNPCRHYRRSMATVVAALPADVGLKVHKVLHLVHVALAPNHPCPWWPPGALPYGVGCLASEAACHSCDHEIIGSGNCIGDLAVTGLQLG